MAELLEWQNVDAPQAAVRALAPPLHHGGLLVLPSETGYLAAVAATSEEGLERFDLLTEEGHAVVGLAGPESAADWSPGLPAVARRLLRRAWPGPLTVSSPALGGLLGRMPDGVRGRVAREGWVRLACPAHEVVQEVIRELAAPLLLAPLPGGTSLREVLPRVADGVDLVVDDGPAPLRQPPTVVRVGDGGWSVASAGAITEEQLRLHAACLVVFVCTGNTCRSPMAEALCKRRLADRLGCRPEDLPARGYLVLSAGLAAHPGGAAAEEAQLIARAAGGDLSQHRSRPLSADLAARADHLVTMTRSHLRALVDHYPALGCRPRLLDPSGADVDDPVGQSLPVYEACTRDIDGHLEPFIETLTSSPC